MENLEVRDLRVKERFMLDNEFFNGYAKILGANALAVYCSLCRHADKNQKCFPSIKKISEEIAISMPAIIEYIKMLELFNIIKKERLGKQCTNRYWLLDKTKWRKDFNVILSSLTTGEVKLLNEWSKATLLQGLSYLTSIVRINKRKDKQKKGLRATPAEEDFNFNSLKEKMQASKDWRMPIIAAYWKYQNIEFKNREQYSAGLKRELRPAGNLIGYPLERIKEVMYWLNGEDFLSEKWTLETVHKYIDRDLNLINEQKYEKPKRNFN